MSFAVFAALPALALSANIEVERVVEGRLSERAALVLPLAARQLDARTSFGLSAGANLGPAQTAGMPMSLTVAIGDDPALVLLTIPWVAATGDPLGVSPFGNFGLAVRVRLYESPALRIGLLTELWLATARARSARALAFGFEMPRYAPRAHTASLGAAAELDLYPLIAGINAGADGHLHVDPVRSDTKDVSFWSELWVGAPLELGTLTGARFWISPLFEVNARSTHSWLGATGDVVFTGGLSFTHTSRRFAANDEVLERFVISAGYQTNAIRFGAGAENSGRTDRVMVAVDFGAFFDRALYREVRGEL